MTLDDYTVPPPPPLPPPSLPSPPPPPLPPPPPPSPPICPFSFTQVKKKKAQLKSELESCRQQLETQTRVSRQLEHERDRAYDDFELAKVTLTHSTLIVV